MIHQIQLIRHASLLIRIQHLSFLADPMLSGKEAMEPVANAANDFRIPMVDLPFPEARMDEIIREVDAVLLTHLHRDHWDAEAIRKIPKNKPLLCQPSDAGTLQAQGFSQVIPVESFIEWHGIRIHRTPGRHGTGEIGEKMGLVSGFVLSQQEVSLYIAGDTIWYEDIKRAIETHRPSHIIVNAGGARFLSGDPITMNAEQIIELQKAAPAAKIIAVHLDTVTHCLEKRTDLSESLKKAGIAEKVLIPADGESVPLK